MADNIQWGIIGLGKISNAFARDLMIVKGCELSAVASRSISKAQTFAKTYEAKTAYGSYEELFQDDTIDIVYIGTPHDSHAEWAIRAMEAGKHVLCEKPLGVNAPQVKQMIKASEKNKVFLMEALWSRFNPIISEIIERVKLGDIGQVNYMNADFSFATEADDSSRLFNPDLAGGSILDIGIYPLFLSYSILGVPDDIVVRGRKHTTGIDSQMVAILEYKDAYSLVMSGLLSKSDMVARICGTKGSFFISETWHESESYTHLNIETGTKKVIDLPKSGKGYVHEIEACTKSIRSGKLQNDKWSLSNSLELIELCDSIRNKLDIKYPFE